MSPLLFEFKVRVGSFREAEEILGHLRLGHHRISHVNDTYLVTDSNMTEKIYEENGHLFFVKVTPQRLGFSIEKEPIDQVYKESLLATRKVNKMMKKTRRAWRIGSIEVAIDEVWNLGVFIEINGDNQAKMKALLAGLGFRDNDLITLPYNKL